MPTVIAIQGSEDAVDEKSVKGCKKVVLKKRGCTVYNCPVETPKGIRWRFKKGSMRCPRRGR
jgi:hypothetical protein